MPGKAAQWCHYIAPPTPACSSLYLTFPSGPRPKVSCGILDCQDVVLACSCMMTHLRRAHICYTGFQAGTSLYVFAVKTAAHHEENPICSTTRMPSLEITPWDISCTLYLPFTISRNPFYYPLLLELSDHACDIFSWQYENLSTSCNIILIGLIVPWQMKKCNSCLNAVDVNDQNKAKHSLNALCFYTKV